MRRAAPDDLVELVDVPERPQPGDDLGRPDRRIDEPESAAERIWRRVGPDPVIRVATLVTALLLVAAAVAAAIAVRADPARRAVTRVVADSRPAGPVDALGCPVRRTCAVRNPPGIYRAVWVIRPDLEITSAFETYDRATAVVYRRQFVARSASSAATVTLESECNPNAGRTLLPPPTGGVYRTHQVDGVRIVEQEWSGSLDPGCSSTVRARAALSRSAGDDEWDPSLLRLGTDEAIRVHP